MGASAPGVFKSYTSAAANQRTEETILDLDIRNGIVGVLGVDNGVPVLQTYARSNNTGDFLTLMNEIQVGTAIATGAMLLPSLD